MGRIYIYTLVTTLMFWAICPSYLIAQSETATKDSSSRAPMKLLYAKTKERYKEKIQAQGQSSITLRSTLRLLIGKRGEVLKTLVIVSDDDVFTADLISIVVPSMWFTPGIRGGKPIKVWVTIPFKIIIPAKEKDE